LSKSACAEEVVNSTVTDPAPLLPLPEQTDEDPITTEETKESREDEPDADKQKEKQKSNSTDMVVIKALLISTGAIVFLLIVATILVRRYGWRSTTFISHVKLENKGCHCSEEVNHTLIKVEDPST